MLSLRSIYQSQSQRSPSSEWIFDVITRVLSSVSHSVLEGPVDVLQSGRSVDVLVDGLAADHVPVHGVRVTATAKGLHVVVVDDGGVGQHRWRLVEVQAVVQGLIGVHRVPATVAAAQVLLQRELLGDEVGEVLWADVAHVQDGLLRCLWLLLLIVGNELGLDESAVRGVQLVVQRRHQQVLCADHLLDLVPVPVQIEASRLEDLLRKTWLL